MRQWMTVAAVALCVLSGCGEKPEAKLTRAEMLLDRGKLPEALDVASQVVAARPNNARALGIKARALARLGRLDEAVAAVEQLLRTDTDPHSLAQARRLRVELAWNRMELLRSSSRFTDEASGLHQQFENERLEGLQQVAALAEQEKLKVEPAYMRARFGRLDLNALDLRLANAEHAKADQALIEPGQDADARIADLKNQREQKYEEIEQQLKIVLGQDPHYKDACEMLTLALMTRGHWGDLWTLANQMAGQKDLSAAAAAQLVLALHAIPDGLHALAQRAEVGWKLQQAVETKEQASPVWLLSSARLNLMLRHADQALPLLDQALKLDPRNAEVRWLSAQCLYFDRQYDKAKEMIDPVLESSPNVASVQMIAGLIYREVPGHMAQAKEALKRAKDLDPNNEEIRHAWANMQMQEAHGDPSEVTALYQQYPADVRMIGLKLTSDLLRGQMGDYKTTLEATERIEPLTAGHLALLVDGYQRLHNADKAVLYAQALVKQRDDLTSNLILASAMLSQGDSQVVPVQNMLAGLKQRFPDTPGEGQMMAGLYYQRGSYDKAVKLLEDTVRDEPGNLEARLMLARSYTFLSLMDDALRQVDMILEKNPNDARAHDLAFRIYYMMGETEKGREHLQHIDPAQSTDPVVQAQFQVRQGHFDEAAVICEQAIQNGSPDPWLRLLLASVYQEKKDPARVEMELNDLVELLPDNVQAYLVLSRFYYEQKDIARGNLRLEALRGRNEVLARLAQARMLASAAQFDDATAALEPIYAPLIRNHSQVRMALVVADELAKIQALKHNVDAAVAVYDKMRAEKVNVPESCLRQIVLLSATNRVTVESTTVQLDALLQTLKPEDHAVRADVIRQFVAMGLEPHALELLEQWLKEKPGDTDLMRWQGEMLLDMGRGPEAIEVYQKLVNVGPDQLAARLRLARAHALAGDYPGAMAVLEEAGKSDAGARITALAEMGQMFVRLGLYQQGQAVFDELERTGRANDPRVAYASGMALMSLGQDLQAAQRFGQVPPYANNYAAAQVRLAEIEQRQGKDDAVKSRLESLLRDPTTVGFAAQELLRLDLTSGRYEFFFRWSDDVINVDYLPRELRRAWIQVRVTAADARRDWVTAERTLQQFAASTPDAVNAQAARLMVLIFLKRVEEARNVLVHDQTVKQSQYGPLLAAALGEPMPPRKDYPALPTLVAAMAQGDLAAARQALPKLEVLPTIYRSDLQKLLDRPDAASPEMVGLFRKLALAMSATDVGLPQLAVDTCQAIIKVQPAFTPAHGVLLQVLGRTSRAGAMLDAQTALLQDLPDSTLALYVTAQRKADAKDYAGAVACYNQIMQREPDHYLVRSLQAKMLEVSGQYDQAIALLEKSVTFPGLDYVQQCNDLAYLMAEHQPQRLAEAYKIAQDAYHMGPNMPPLLDTLGWIEHLRGDDQKAIGLLTRCVPHMQNIPEIHYHLGVIYCGLGQKAWARYHLNQALADNKDNTLPWVARAKGLLAHELQ
jgi:tetratricopeptide (TPR) repeat protein